MISTSDHLIKVSCLDFLLTFCPSEYSFMFYCMIMQGSFVQGNFWLIFFKSIFIVRKRRCWSFQSYYLYYFAILLNSVNVQQCRRKANLLLCCPFNYATLCSWYNGPIFTSSVASTENGLHPFWYAFMMNKWCLWIHTNLKDTHLFV